MRVHIISLCGLPSSCVVFNHFLFFVCCQAIYHSAAVGKLFKNNKAINTQFKFNFTNCFFRELRVSLNIEAGSLSMANSLHSLSLQLYLRVLDEFKTLFCLIQKKVSHDYKKKDQLSFLSTKMQIMVILFSRPR